MCDSEDAKKNLSITASIIEQKKIQDDSDRKVAFHKRRWQSATDEIMRIVSEATVPQMTHEAIAIKRRAERYIDENSVSGLELDMINTELNIVTTSLESYAEDGSKESLLKCTDAIAQLEEFIMGMNHTGSDD